MSVLSTAVALLITRSLDLSVFPTPLFFAAVVNSTWFGGVKSGLLTVGLAALTLDYYFIPGRESFVTALPHLLQFVLPALLTLWFVQKRKVAEFSLRAARDELRAKVRERTNQLRIESAERERAEQTVHRTQAQLAHVNRVMTTGELATSIAPAQPAAHGRGRQWRCVPAVAEWPEPESGGSQSRGCPDGGGVRPSGRDDQAHSRVVTELVAPQGTRRFARRD